MIEVRRLPRNSTVGFERLSNASIRNAELSLAAVGLLARLLADGDRYDSIDDIADAYSPPVEGGKRPHGRGRDAYRKAALELEAAGHLVRAEEKSAGSRVRTLVRAMPEKAQVGAATESPSRERRAQTDETAGQPRDGKSVAGVSWESDAYQHVEPTTDFPSRRPPAERAVSARQSRDGKSVPVYMQTYSQTSDLLLQTEPTADEPLPPAPEKQEEVDGRALEPNPEALAIITAVDLGGMCLAGKLHGEVAGILTRKLAEGWTRQALMPKFEGCTVNAPNPPGVFATRVRALGSPPVAAPRHDMLPDWCGRCGDNDPAARVNAKFRRLHDSITGPKCPDCHPDMIGA